MADGKKRDAAAIMQVLMDAYFYLGERFEIHNFRGPLALGPLQVHGSGCRSYFELEMKLLMIRTSLTTKAEDGVNGPKPHGGTSD